jgi:hypothetical protein
LKRNWGVWLFLEEKRFFIILHKKERFKTFLIIFLLSGLYVFIFSESGILERRELNKKYDRLTAKIDYIKKENDYLQKESGNYRSGSYRENDIMGSGFVYKTGKLVYFKDKEKEIISPEVKHDDLLISLDHLRIIWIIISLMFLFYYFLKNNNNELNDGSDFN